MKKKTDSKDLYRPSVRLRKFVVDENNFYCASARQEPVIYYYKLHLHRIHTQLSITLSPHRTR